MESTPGKGTAFIFRLPLTLALIDGLLVETGGGRYVVPMEPWVEEYIAHRPDREWQLSPPERPLRLGAGQLVPTVSLRVMFHSDGLGAPERQELLLTRHAGRRASGCHWWTDLVGARSGGDPVAGREFTRA